MRTLALAACLAALAAGTSFAQEARAPRGERPEAELYRPDPFVISSDVCGASRYAHLLGEPYARLHHASVLPAHSVVAGARRATTLEFRPGQLNVVLDAAGRIVAIGCF